MSADFISCPVPAGVPVGGALGVSELDIVNRLCGTDIGVECRFQQSLGLLPVCLGDKVNSSGIFIHCHILPDGRFVVLKYKSYHCF